MSFLRYFGILFSVVVVFVVGIRIIYEISGEFIWIFFGFSWDGAGVLLGGLPPRCRPSGLRIKSAMTG